MKLPLLISVPHAGLDVPSEVAELNLLSPAQIAADGDVGAAEIYDIEDQVAVFITTPIARAYVDMNRAANDIRPDGVVKTETIHKEPIYQTPLNGPVVQTLLTRYHAPYHRKLTELASGAELGIDCHTMEAVAPAISPDAGAERPLICLSDANGTCPRAWTQLMADCLAAEFGIEIAINDPFQGGYIIKSHAAELPWLQLELSRAKFMTIADQRTCLINAFTRWIRDRP